MRKLTYIFILLLTLAAACHRSDSLSRQLDYIDSLCDSDPRLAISLLDSIDRNGISANDRHRLDLLKIKSRDKAYVWHTSDSLILDVVKWYASHPQDKVYPEAVYYAGRVYSDLGDKPTALGYFQQALDLLPDTESNQELRLRILSQTGRLLTSLRLYEEGEIYIRQSLAIAEQRKDTVIMVQEFQLLGSNLLRNKDYSSAWECFDKALKLSLHLPDGLKAKSQMYQALIKHRIGDSDEAVRLISGIPDRVEPETRNSALANAAYIFRKAGMPDSAMKYASELIHSKIDIQKGVGYDVYFSILAERGIFPDSIYGYLNNYLEKLEKQYDQNASALTITQESLYNYRKHDIERQRAEETRDKNLLWLYILEGCLACAITIIFYTRYHKQRRIIRLQETYNNVVQLKNDLQKENDLLKAQEENPLSIESNPNEKIQLEPITTNEQNLRERLKTDLLALAENRNEKYRVPSEILQSDMYRALQEKIDNGKFIKDDDPLWRKIEKAVMDSSPKFRDRLTLLASGRLSLIDYHTALLLKCGIKPSHMAILAGRSPGSIVSRRETLGMKVLDEKTGLAVVDRIIQSL